MRGPVLIDLSHTSHTAARTGVQRVALGLRKALGGDAWEVTYDPYARQWRGLEPWETDQLEGGGGGRAGKRGAYWPRAARVRGRLRRLGQALSWQDGGPGDFSKYRLPTSELAHTRGLIVPEIFSPEIAEALPALMAEVDGPRVALFHDAIALRLPEMTPPKVVARFPAYLRELARFDGVAAVSEASRMELLGFWEWAGIWDTPPVIALPLGVEPAITQPNKVAIRDGAGGARPPGALGIVRVQPRTRSNPARPSSKPPIGEVGLHPQILSVGSIEGRKNHVALLEACELLWQRGFQFDLRLIGLAQRQTGTAALDLIEKLQHAGRPLRYDRTATDEERDAAYGASSFTVYPSLAEGFGLPVAESLIRGKPCICSGEGALGEVAAGGGCLTVPEPSRDALAAACARLLETPAELSHLTALARARIFPTPAEHARRLMEWMGELGR